MIRAINISLFGLLFFVFSSNAQSEIIHSFTDHSNGHLTRVYDIEKVDSTIVITGNIKNDTAEFIQIIKLSKEGELIWSTSTDTVFTITANPWSYYCIFFEIALVDSNYIYGVGNSPGGGYTTMNWKVDINTGHVEYINTDYPGFFTITTLEIDIKNYDSLRFVQILGGPVGIDTQLEIRDKANGNLLDSVILGAYGLKSCVNIDDEKNIYASDFRYLYKFNKDNLQELIWKIDMFNDISEPIDEDIYEFWLDDFGDAYTISRKSGSHSMVSKFDTQTGKEIWHTVLPFNLYLLRDYRDSPDYILMAYNDSQGSDDGYHNVKINKNDGQIVWHSITYGGNSINNTESYDIDINCEEEIYVTGTAGSSPGNKWTGLKLDQNGGPINYRENIIELDDYSENSYGVELAIFGNEVIDIGMIESATDTLKACFQKYDPDTDSTIIRKFIGTEAKCDSYVAEILTDSTYIYSLDQYAREVFLTKLSPSDSIIWTIKVNSNDTLSLKAGNLVLNEFGNIVVTNTFSLFDSTDCGTQDPDGILFSSFDPSGTLLAESNSLIDSSSTSVRLIELETNNNFSYCIYGMNDSIVKIKSWDGNNILDGGILDSSFHYNDFIGLHDVLKVHQSDLYFSGSEHLIKINGTNLSFTSYTNSSLPFHPVDSEILGDTLFSCGFDENYTQILNATNLQTGTEYYYQNYGSGQLISISLIDSGLIYLAGNKDANINLLKVNYFDGVLNGTYTIETADSANVLASIFIDSLSTFIFSGFLNNSSNSTDAFIVSSSKTGDSLWTDIYEDELGDQSYFTDLEKLNDYVVYTSGELNDGPLSFAGIVAKIDLTPEADTAIVDTTNSIEQSSIIEEVLLYPNPAKNELFVSYDRNLLENVEIEIIDLTGKLCLRKQISQNVPIDVSVLESGTYYIRFRFENQILSKVFVKTE